MTWFFDEDHWIQDCSTTMELQRFYKKVKLFRLTYFLVKNTKYKTVQPLCGMDLQRFYKKAKALTIAACPHCHTHLKQRLFL